MNSFDIEAAKEKILSRIKIDNNNCWIWTGFIHFRGYGAFTFRKKTWRSHRLSYRVFKGELDPTKEIDHLCRVRACANPDHLEQVTKRENILRGISCSAKNAKKVSCPHGHEYTRRPSGTRYCKICTRATYVARFKTIEERRAYNNERYRLSKIDKISKMGEG